MGVVRLILVVSLFSVGAFGACSAQKKAILVKDTQAACKTLKRALHVMEKFPDRIREQMAKGTAMPVYLANPTFYQARIRNRLRACDAGGIPMKCVGRCGTERETTAYVLVTLGYIGKTINFCSEYFDGSGENGPATIAHEFGRLENIGDSEGWETNNIFLWDTILTALTTEPNYSSLTAPRR